MSGWRVARSLEVLRAEINTVAPGPALRTLTLFLLSSGAPVAVERAGPAFSSSASAHVQVVARVSMALRAMRLSAVLAALATAMIAVSVASNARSESSVLAPAHLRVGVAVDAVRLRVALWLCHCFRWRRDNRERPEAAVDRRRVFDVASAPILGNSHRFKVVRSYAATIATQVIHFVTGWYRANLVCIRPTVRGRLCPLAFRVLDCKGAIAALSGATGPQPAAVVRVAHARPEPSTFMMLIFHRIQHT